MFLPFKEIPFTYCISVSIILVSIAGLISKGFYNKLRFHPYAVFRGERMHTLFTSAFIHNNLAHLLFNIYLLYLMSFDLEYVMLDHFPKGSAQIFLLCLFVAVTFAVNLINGWIHRKDVMWTSVGASGAIMAFVTFSTVYLPLDHATGKLKYFPIYYGFEFCLLALVCTVLFTFKRSRYDYFAHLYGAILGIMLAVLVRPELILEIYGHFKSS